jgi:serine/threonine protein kinase/Tol biopolymer transport system component
MSSERWQRVKELFEAALERGPAERAAFLAQACAGDEEIRWEVESLLAAHEGDSRFMNKPLGNLLVVDKPMLAAGQHFGPYEEISQLGEGGMGQVYLAWDTRLGRKVALKLLPSSYTHDEDRVRRFGQEARAASALNHPNIITIYEIGQVDGRHFIAAEYVAGETLRARLERERLETGEALDIAVQVASALASAHKAGIVHRDIKPENIMLRDDGLVKVLDFGLAKLTAAENFDLEAPTRAQVRTSPGMILGTVRYMSPEQARSKEIDSQTDIWSFGVVLYEMLAGRLPFNGETSSDVLAAILKNEPVPLAAQVPELPKELERIVSKALRKNRETRYQNITDLLIDLRDLKQELEFSAKLERTASPTKNEKAITAQAPTKTEIQNAQTTSSAEYLVGEIKRHKGGALLVLGALIVAVAGITFGVYRFAGRKQLSAKPSAPLQEMKVRRLTSTGKAADAAISPDGRYLVHVLADGGKQSLWLRQVETTSNVQIVPPADVLYSGLNFSRDGNYIYYNASDKGTQTLYKMPVLGGAPKKLVVEVDSTVAFSPDGKLMAFIRGDPAKGENALIVANADGTAEKRLAVRKEPGSFNNWPYARNAPAWSPDGQSIAAPAGVGGGGPSESVIEVRVADGAMKLVTPRKWWRIEGVEWLRDGSGLVVNASEQSSSPFQIWHLSYPGGEAHRITNDPNDYRGVSLTADSKVLVTVQSEVLSNIWIAPHNDAGLAKQVTSGRYDGQEWVAVTPDNKIVYASRAGGNYDLWITDADGGNQKQLTAHAGNNDHPAVTPDGRYVVFISDRTGSSTPVWRVDIDGSNPSQLTDGGGWYPECSSDGQWVIYTSKSTGELWKVPIDGGKPVRVTDYYVPGPAVSPDGKWIASLWYRDTSKVAIIPFEGGEPIKTLDIGWTRVHWTPDGRALAYVDRRDPSNISSRPLDGGPPRQLTDFKSDRIFSFAWSRDGKQLALARGTLTNDVILISDFR